MGFKWKILWFVFPIKIIKDCKIDNGCNHIHQPQIRDISKNTYNDRSARVWGAIGLIALAAAVNILINCHKCERHKVKSET